MIIKPRNLLLICLVLTSAASAQRPASGWAQTTQPAAAQATPGSGAASGAAFVRENYSKYEYRVAMRDGVKLFTSVYVPKDVITDGKAYPILMQRTPYNVAPYGVDKYRATLGPSEHFAREKFIFAYQDVRGRFMSEGDFTIIRPHKPVKGPKDTDESTDCYDTVEWLIKNVAGNTGKVGMWGVSQPGFFAAAGMIDAHPALVAVSPQAPVTDYYMGDDSYHNGAFMLAHRFRFYQGFRQREGDPAPPPAALPFDYGTPDGYEFYLNMGSLAAANEKYFKQRQIFWTQNIEHPSYDEFWQTRSIWKHLKGIKPAVMIVGGWYDQEDPQGPLRMFDFMQKNSPPQNLMLVMGPWSHGGFARGDGDKLGNVNFGSKTGVYYREKIEFPFFLYHLKGKGDVKFPKAWLFETGMNQWRKIDAWPPQQGPSRTIYLETKGKLSWQSAVAQVFDEYLSVIRGEPFRGKYRKSFERPVPFEPGKPDRIAFMLPDVAHTFRAGHRIMIQVQSSWFPLTDRNPQKFMDIPKAQASDFVKATQRVFVGGADGSRIQFLVAE